MAVAQIHETFSRLFYSISKNLGFLVGNPAFWHPSCTSEENKTIFWISLLNCVEWYKVQNSFKKKFPEKIWAGSPRHISSKTFFFRKCFFAKIWLFEGYTIISEQKKTASVQENPIWSCLCERRSEPKGLHQLVLAEKIFFRRKLLFS